MDKVKFGIIGTNFISDWMVECGKRDPRFEAIAVYSRKQETGELFAAKHDIPRVYTTLEAMLRDDDIQVVYVASPNAFHFEHTMAALQAGKHVLCEKPIAASAHEARIMYIQSKESGRLLVEAMIPTLSPVLQAVRANLHNVGTVRRYFASYCQYSSRYDNLKRGIVANAFKPELANGAIMDIGVYCISPMVSLFGKPETVFSQCYRLSTGVDGQGTVVAGYDGFDGVAIYSKIADSHLPTEIQGEDGTITIDRINSPRRAVFTPHDKTQPSQVLCELPEDYNPYSHEITHFIDLIEAGATESPLNTAATSISTMVILDQVRTH